MVPRTIFLSIVVVICRSHDIHPDYGLSMEKHIKVHGYPVEVHQVETRDDFILSLYHIPHGHHPRSNVTTKKNIVLIVHGLAGSPNNFIVLGPKIAAPYYFADKGMDVWLFSSRGIEGGVKKMHKYLNPDRDDEFWNHSLHEIGKYDVSATIDYILNYTGSNKLSLIGQSAGGNQIFCLFSELPAYREKVNVAISWGSSPIINKVDYPLLTFILEFNDLFKKLANMFEMAEFMPVIQKFKPFIKVFCADDYWQTFCVKLYSFVGSHRSIFLRPNDVQLIWSSLPRLSFKQVIHFSENVRNGTFRKFDYGVKRNLKEYGQTYPPSYNLSAATCPTAFFIGPSDSEITKDDVCHVSSLLPNMVKLHEVDHPKFTHLDFLFAPEAAQLVYEPTYQLMTDIANGLIPPASRKPQICDYII